jgi:hypothetical protein
MTYLQENHHSVLIACAPSQALPEIIRWGEATWWPKDSLMRFEREGSGEVRTGTRYRQKVLMPFAPSWDVEVTRLEDSGITRRFLNGMFEGEETVAVKPRGSGVEVSYRMSYSINGSLNRVLWPLVFRRLHDRSIEAILANLKRFLEKKT